MTSIVFSIDGLGAASGKSEKFSGSCVCGIVEACTGGTRGTGASTHKVSHLQGVPSISSASILPRHCGLRPAECRLFIDAADTLFTSTVSH